jgi:hypothetical protein
MTSPDSLQLLQLFQKIAPAWFFRELRQGAAIVSDRGVYSAAVVVWLMIWQRLQGHRSLAAAVQYLLQGGARELKIDYIGYGLRRISSEKKFITVSEC